MRWSSPLESCKTIAVKSEGIQCYLKETKDNDKENGETQREAWLFYKKIYQLETAFMSILWNVILGRFDRTTVKLQKPGLDLVVDVNLLTSLQEFVTSLWSQFDNFEDQVKQLGSYVDEPYHENYKSTKMTKIWVMSFLIFSLHWDYIGLCPLPTMKQCNCSVSLSH